jgi:hypothetical protein
VKTTSIFVFLVLLVSSGVFAVTSDVSVEGKLDLNTSVIFRQSTANYTLQWNNPAAARALTLSDPGADDTFVMTSETQTLTNKTLTDTSTFIQNGANNTKKVTFEASALPASETRAWVPGTGVPQNIQVFASSGTWTRPAGVGTVYVQVWGGGGGGVTAGNNTSGGGGGGGGYSAGLVSVNGNVTVTVGTGGGAGVNGNPSSFAGVATLTGAAGSTGATTTGGAGGAGSGGTINLTGGSGGNSEAADGASGGTGGGSPMGGAGGSGGPGANAGGVAVAGRAGTPPGGGGGGGQENGGLGGAGANGLVIVYY